MVVDLALVLILVLGCTKLCALAWTFPWLFREGGPFRAKYAARTRLDADMAAEWGPARPIEYFVFPRFPPALRALARTVFLGYVTVLICVTSVALAAGFSIGARILVFLVALAGAAISSLLLIQSFLRRLILGRTEALLEDLRLPAWMTRLQWACAEQETNLAIYFLVVSLTLFAGFGGLYAGWSYWHPLSFAIHGTSPPSIATWFYFSLVTVSTTGFGDVTPATAATQVAVGLEILAGPVLLTWLLAGIALTLARGNLTSDTDLKTSTGADARVDGVAPTR